MSMATADKVLAALLDLGAKRQPDGTYRSDSPFRPGSDSFSFVVSFDADGEHGAFYDHVSGQQGSLYELADMLHIERPEGIKRNGVENTKRAYKDMADYARAHGIAPQVLEKALWQEVEHKGRKALEFPTASGKRYRFIDGEKPPYMHDPGYKTCWYGLKPALEIIDALQKAEDRTQPLILCNGEISTVVAHHYGLPACCITSGEKRIPDELLQELNSKYQGDIWLTYDCDDTGRRVAQQVSDQLPRGVVIDLGLGESGDLADFCMLHGADTLKDLQALAPRLQTLTTMSDEAADAYIESIESADFHRGFSYVIPFAGMRKMGGFCRLVEPGKTIGLLAPSGYGKTSFIETWVDATVKRGEGVMFYGPEWDAEEMHARRVQRYSQGKCTFEDWQLHKQWLREIKYNIPVDKRFGVKMTPEKLEASRSFTRSIKAWPGKTEYFPSSPFLDATLQQMETSLNRRRAAGERVTLAVFDYAQLLQVAEAKDNPKNMFEQAVALVKHFCVDNAIVGLIALQVNKDSSKLHQKNTGIEVSDANYVREDTFNLFFSLNLLHNEVQVGDSVEYVPTKYGFIKVLKNSMAPKGRVNIMSDFENLRWVDLQWETRHLNEPSQNGASAPDEPVGEIDLSNL